MPHFSHLHVHTHFSLQDATCKPEKLVARVKELGMSSAAITDHGNMCGCLEFYDEARKNGIKPIIGCETYVAHESAALKTRQGPAGIGYHLVLLARNITGYKNLIALVSYGYLHGLYYGKARIDRELLAKHSNGLIALSACLKGEPATHLLGDDPVSAEETVRWYQNTLGKENYYIELMNHGIDEQEKIFKPLISLAKKTGAKTVATNDVHYLLEEDARSHEILYCLQNKTTLSDPNHRHFTTNEFYLKSVEEMREAFIECPEAVENSVEIASRCNLDLAYDKYRLPQYQPPDPYTAEEYLYKLAEDGLKKRYPTISPEIKERFEFEYGVITKMEFTSYFLIVWDFVNYAKTKGIPVGPGRGSGAGSLLAYSLGITNIDPMKYDLLFERFLNPERISMPDFDIDFCEARRSEVLEYVKQKYGEENVCQIITFSSLKARAAVRDVGRVMDIPLPNVDTVAKLVQSDEMEEALKESEELRSMYEKDSQTREWLDTCSKLQGIYRHASTHAAGVVIADRPLINYVPFYRNQDDITIQFDMSSVEKAKLLKMDFLGLRTLTIIELAVKLIKQISGKDIDLDSIPLDDKKTFQLLQDGNTVGVFQMESTGFQDILRRSRPDKFTDLIALNALYRPGPLRSGMVDVFIKRKNGEEDIKYLDDSIKSLLEETYGVIVFQEQVMRISNIVGGFSLGEADTLRKAMSKKQPEVLAQFEDKFVKGAVKKGLKQNLAKTIFDQIKHFGGYGFNKSHSTAYAYLAYQTAYLKAHYPHAFMAAMLTCLSGDTEKVAKYIDECKNILKIKILPPDINESFTDFTVQGKAIRFGLSAIKNVGIKAVESLIEARKTLKRNFTSLYDFTDNVDLRTVNNKVIESLIKAGAFDSFNAKRSQLMAVLDHAVEVGNISQRDRQKGQDTLFGMSEESSTGNVAHSMPDIPEWEDYIQLQYEKEMLGFYISSHPLAKYEDILKEYSTMNTKQMAEMENGQDINIIFGCLISKCKNMNSRRTNEPMATLVLEDLDNKINAVVLPAVFKEYSKFVNENEIVFVEGILEKDSERISIRIQKIIPIINVLKTYTKKIVIRMNEIGLQNNFLEKIQTIISAHHGRCPIIFEVETTDGNKVYLQSGSTYSVLPNNKLLKELNDLLGRENVFFKK